VQIESKFPPELLNLFENMEQAQYPWGIAPSDRAKWTADLNVKRLKAGKDRIPVLYRVLRFVRCPRQAGDNYYHKNPDAAGVTWGILGKDEKCCGDSLRRLGNEYVFDKMARENIKQYQDKGVIKIITECPHCFHRIKE